MSSEIITPFAVWQGPNSAPNRLVGADAEGRTFKVSSNLDYASIAQYGKLTLDTAFRNHKYSIEESIAEQIVSQKSLQLSTKTYAVTYKRNYDPPIHSGALGVAETQVSFSARYDTGIVTFAKFVQLYPSFSLFAESVFVVTSIGGTIQRPISSANNELIVTFPGCALIIGSQEHLRGVILKALQVSVRRYMDWTLWDAASESRSAPLCMSAIIIPTKGSDYPATCVPLICMPRHYVMNGQIHQMDSLTNGHLSAQSIMGFIDIASLDMERAYFVHNADIANARIVVTRKALLELFSGDFQA